MDFDPVLAAAGRAAWEKTSLKGSRSVTQLGPRERMPCPDGVSHDPEIWGIWGIMGQKLDW